MKKEKFAFLSNNKESLINAVIFSPEEGRCHGVIQILHGMSDRILRYSEVAEVFTQNGYIVCGHDMIGHGDSAPAEQRGHIKGKKGYTDLVEDVNLVQNEIRKRYPNLPIILLGHSMGAEVAKLYASIYGKHINGLILSGTRSENLSINLPILLTLFYMKKKGEMAPSTEVDKLLFKNINKRFEPTKTTSDWLSRDEEMVRKFVDDPKCCFPFTYRGLLNLLLLIKEASRRKNLVKIPAGLPILMFTGSDDASSRYGVKITRLYKRLKSYGKESVTLKIYENGRHEMLNEINRQDVYEDVLKWLKSV